MKMSPNRPFLLSDDGSRYVGLKHPDGTDSFGIESGSGVAWSALPSAAEHKGGQVYVSDIGVNGSVWRSDGTLWNPVDQIIILARASSALATPLATLSGVTAGIFTLPAGQIIIPAGLLRVGSLLEVEGIFRKNGTTATCSATIRLEAAPYLGTANGANLVQRTMANVNGGFSRNTSRNFILSSTSLLTTATGATNVDLSSSSIAERTSTIDMTVEQQVKFTIESGNASDTYNLIGYEVRVSV